MSDTDFDLTALIGSRICHDLISPIGAINNGIELLNMSGSVDGPEMSLISESVGSASARIRFFRIAFGAAGDQLVGRGEILSILKDLYEHSRVSVAWGPVEGCTRADVRMAFLSLMCLETAMPYGGRIEVGRNAANWDFQVRADKLNVTPALWEMLTQNAPIQEVLPAHVQFALLPHIARDENRTLQVTYDAQEISLRF